MKENKTGKVTMLLHIPTLDRAPRCKRDPKKSLVFANKCPSVPWKLIECSKRYCKHFQSFFCKMNIIADQQEAILIFWVINLHCVLCWHCPVVHFKFKCNQNILQLHLMGYYLHWLMHHNDWKQAYYAVLPISQEKNNLNVISERGFHPMKPFWNVIVNVM